MSVASTIIHSFWPENPTVTVALPLVTSGVDSILAMILAHMSSFPALPPLP